MPTANMCDFRPAPRFAGNTSRRRHRRLTWTFPAAFVSNTYRPAALPNFSAAENRAPRVTNKTPTSLDVSVFNTANARVATGLEIMAIGRWF